MASRTLRSVTSMVRTWPSTIFRRAVEKPDICGPCNADDAANQSWPHLWNRLRENATRPLARADQGCANFRVCATRPRRNDELFDRDREAADQRGDFVQPRRF